MFLFNIYKKNNYSFFDKESGVYFNRAVYKRNDIPSTSGIKRAIKSGTIIDVFNKYKIELKEEVLELNEKMIKVMDLTVKDTTKKDNNKDLIELSNCDRDDSKTNIKIDVEKFRLESDNNVESSDNNVESSDNNAESSDNNAESSDNNVESSDNNVEEAVKKKKRKPKKENKG